MKHMVNLSSVIIALSCSFGAFAQNTPAVQKALDSSNFSYILKLQDRFSLLDSARGSAFDSFSQTVRFGLNYNYNRLLATFVVQYDGGSAEVGGSTRIRQGALRYMIIKSDADTLTASIGREHLSSAVIYAPDAFAQLFATNLDNFNTGEDGASLYYTHKSKLFTTTLGAGVFNTLGMRTFGTNGYLSYSNPISSTVTEAGTVYNKAALNDKRAYVFQGRLETSIWKGSLQANALYGMQDSSPMDSTTAASVRDTSYFEGSLGYVASDKSLQFGTWYQDTNLGKVMVRADSLQSASGNFNYINVNSGTSSEQTTFGLGVKATSDMFGWNNFSGDNVGERFTAGASFQHLGGVMSPSSYAYSATTGADPLFGITSSTVDSANIAVGYTYSLASFEVNYVTMNASNNVFFTGSSTVSDKKNTANLVYLSGVLAL